jgi:hypothetical protein
MPSLVKTPRRDSMSAMGAEWGRVGSKDFFAREYFLEDIRWMVARLLGNPDPRADVESASGATKGRGSYWSRGLPSRRWG